MISPSIIVSLLANNYQISKICVTVGQHFEGIIEVAQQIQETLLRESKESTILTLRSLHIIFQQPVLSIAQPLHYWHLSKYAITLHATLIFPQNESLVSTSVCLLTTNKFPMIL